MISIIIPTKNEPLINDLIRDINENVNEEHEIIVVDKSDAPPELVGGKLVEQKSDGLGNAFLEGMRHASGESIVLMDGDFSHDPKYIPLLVDALKNADVVIGSRFVDGGKTLDSHHRKLVSFFFRNFASLILNLPLHDSMSGFGAIRREVLEGLRLNPLGYKVLLEIAYKSKRLGCELAEVPIVFNKRRAGKTKAGLKEAFRTLILIVELRLGLR